MNRKEALKKLYNACDNDLLYEQSGILYPNELIEIIEQDLDRFKELVKVIRILKTRKYAKWIKNKFYDGVGYDEEKEKLFKKVFGSSWRKY